MRALVTGATGFIGSRLCRELTNRGWKIRALAMPNESISRIEDCTTGIVRGDLTRPDTLCGICKDIDVVFHLAARVTDWGSRKTFYTAILDCTKNVLGESVGQVARFVYLSSIAACGLGRHLKGFTENDREIKTGVPYGDAKLDAEVMVRRCHGSSGLETVIVRPANVIGPGSVWVTDVIARIRKTKIPLLDAGRWGASLVQVDNLADGIVLAGEKKQASGRTYFMRDEWDVTWKRYLTDLSAMVGKQPGISVPFQLAWTCGAVLEPVLTPLGIRPPITRLTAGVMGRDNDVDVTRAKGELGWRSRIDYPQAMQQIAGSLK